MCVCCGSSLLDTTFTLFTQKYDNPSLMLVKTEESRWKQLRVEYISEESDDESDYKSSWFISRSGVLSISKSVIRAL